MLTIDKPSFEDLEAIKKILTQWTTKREASKYLGRISDEMGGRIKFNMRFWVARENGKVLGIIGLADPLPKILPLAKTKRPTEMKILYVDSREQGRGIGKKLVSFIEDEGRRRGDSEIMVRSAKRYKETAWGFYDKLNYLRVGTVSGGEESKIMQVFSKEL